MDRTLCVRVDRWTDSHWPSSVLPVGHRLPAGSIWWKMLPEEPEGEPLGVWGPLSVRGLLGTRGDRRVPSGLAVLAPTSTHRQLPRLPSSLSLLSPPSAQPQGETGCFSVCCMFCLH